MEVLHAPENIGGQASIITKAQRGLGVESDVLIFDQKRKMCSFEGGEKIVIEGAEINLEKTDKICIHALILSFALYCSIAGGVSPMKLGLAKAGNKAYVQCVDPREPYTTGGTVIFEIITEPEED
jgi:uncharacterized repeat protein (TIGR04076 family)